jgi:3-oxoacyl-[acyl-carrier-protein] synthase II
MDPVHQWALCATKTALVDAGLEDALLTSPNGHGSRLGVALGTGLSGRRFIENVVRLALDQKGESWRDITPEELFARAGEFIMRDLNPVDFLQQCPSLAAAFIAMRYRARGPNLTLVSLCAAGAQAIGEAAWTIARGDADVMLAGGADSMLNLVDLSAFCALGAVTGRSYEGAAASKPFDLRRDGCVVGEGAAVLVLENLETAQRRGAHIRAELLGYGTSNDAYKVSAPPEDGEGAYRAMCRALEQARLEPSDVQHVNAHGTSTPLNDRVETIALKRLFAEHAYELTVVSTKSMIGHLIAAAGAIEAVVAVKTREHRVVHPTRNLEKKDPSCDLDYVPDSARDVPDLRAVLSNSFAIGGVNASLAFSRWGDA